jgi:cation transport regulator ChaC
VLAGICKLLLIVVLLGVVVFKLTVLPALFVHRKKLSIYFDDQKRFGLEEPGWLMALRIYNPTQLEIVDIHFQAYLRVPLGDDFNAHTPNQELEIIKPRKTWPIAIPFVPFSLCIPLRASDINRDNGTFTLKSIQGHSIEPENKAGVSFLVLIIRGKTPEVDSEIVETHWFQLSPAPGWEWLRHRLPELEYEFGKFREIAVTPGAKPKKAGGRPEDWRGWDEFEKSDELHEPLNEKFYIFGYGSLVDERELRDYLNEIGVEAGHPKEARLWGYRRAWDVAMDNRENIQGYKYYRDPRSHQRPSCFVTFLNIYPSDASSTNGIAFEVPEKALAELDRRERNYKRIDVTDRFHPQLGGRVWTYIATVDGRARYNTAEHDGSAVIQEEYIAKVERAFQSRGEKFYDQYIKSTDPPTVPRQNLECVKLP